MSKSLDEVMNELPADRRKEVEERAQKLVEEEFARQALRKEQGNKKS